MIRSDDQFRRPNTAVLVALVTFMLALTGLAGFVMVAPTVRNLRRLETAATRFGQGDLTARAEVPSRNAVESVALQFNVMASGIQRTIERERQLLWAVSHELRTPIARLRFSVDFLRESISEVERDRRLQEIDDEIDEIDGLVKELIDYNRLNAAGTKLAPEPIDVAAVLTDVVVRLRQFHPSIAVECRTPKDLPCLLTADSSKCRSVFQNLLLNAMRYANSRVVIDVTREDGAVIVSFSDDGPGVPEAERERIFQPFERIDDSRSKESGGVGLGLAIVHRIMQLHGGSVTVTQAEIGGARFATVWPDGHVSSDITH